MPRLVLMVRDRLESRRFSSTESTAVLLSIVLLYLVITGLAARVQLWHDELFTYYIAKTPSFSGLLDNLRLDLNPPLSYLAVRGSMAVFGDNLYAVRLPSILAFLAGSLCLYSFVRRRLSPVYGLLAMLVFWASPFLYLATEARPYGLIVGFFCMGMLAWQRAIGPKRPGSSVVITALASTGMALSHLFAIFYLFPFGIAELVRWMRSRRPDWALWAALFVPAIIVFVYILLMGAYQAVGGYQAASFPPAFQSSIHKMVGFFYNTLITESLVLLLALSTALFVIFRRPPAQTEAPVALNAIECAFIVGLLALPVIITAVLMRSHGAFFLRYAAPAVLAYALLAAFGLATLTNRNGLAGAVSCSVFVVYLAASQLLMPNRDARSGSNTGAGSISRIDQIRPDLPFVAASGLTFLEMDRYGSPHLVSRLHYLSSRRLAVAYAHATIFEGFSELRKHFPIQASVDSYEQFVVQHPQFLVFGTPDYPEDWLIPRLLDIHASLRYLGDFSGPYKDHQLYEVTMPGYPVTAHR